MTRPLDRATISLPESAVAARAVSSLHYFTGKPCKHGHVSPRRTSDQNCLDCQCAKPRDYAKAKAVRAANPEPYRERCQKWHLENRARRAESDKLSRAANHAARLEAEQARRDANRSVICARANLRNANKLRATPSWANLAAIQAIYDEAESITRLTGIPHQVDHIFPLRGRTSCGLHVETNLQILTAEANRKKNNRLPECATWP